MWKEEKEQIPAVGNKLLWARISSAVPQASMEPRAFELGRFGQGKTLAHLISLGSSAELVDE